MRIVFVKNLNVDEVITKNVLNGDGKILLKAGTKITREHINYLKSSMIVFVYVEDEMLSDVRIDFEMEILKEGVLNKMPRMFDEIVSGNYVESTEALKNVETLVDHIIEEGEVNTNLFEVKTYDDYTYIHSLDTSIMASFLGISLGYDENRLKELSKAAILHDIGKIKGDNELINKSGDLTNEEFSEVKRHAIYGYEILKSAEGISEEIIKGVAEHHERVDGKGYPLGLKGDKISQFAKIISVCDVFTAVSANRCYRDRFDPKEAYELILSGSGTMFDPMIVNKFRETFYVYPLGCHVKLSNNKEGYVVKQNKKFPDRPIIRIIEGDNQFFYEFDLLQNTNVVIEEIIM